MSLLTDLNPFARRDTLPGVDDALGVTRRLWRSSRSLVMTGKREPAGVRVGTIVGGVVAGVVVLGAAALTGQWLRERNEPQPEFDLLREDGAISLRRYRPMIVATADAQGSMKQALDTGFRRLFAYITAKQRPTGDETPIHMTVPVIAAPSGHSGGWLIRFVMPKGKPIQALPQPGPGVRIEEMPERLVAAIRFNGSITDRALEARELGQLRRWIVANGFVAESEPVFAAYNSPIMPGAMRRNEWWIEVARG